MLNTVMEGAGLLNWWVGRVESASIDVNVSP